MGEASFKKSIDEWNNGGEMRTELYIFSEWSMYAFISYIFSLLLYYMHGASALVANVDNALASMEIT